MSISAEGKIVLARYGQVWRGVKPLAEAITEERWDDVPTYVALTAGVINAYSAKLQAATAILDSAGAQTSR